MELIDKYLSSEMNDTEKLQFEKDIASDKNLQLHVDQQHSLLRGVERIKLKSEIKSAHQTAKFLNLIKMVALIITSAVVLAILSYGVWKITSDKQSESVTKEEKTKCQVGDINNLSLQEYIIDNSNDTLLVTDNGSVFVIEKGTFGNLNSVRISVREAFKPSEIMAAGLSTTSGNATLETAGMFHFESTYNNVLIEPQKPILVNVSMKKYDPEMKIFKGKVTESGKVDWIDPRDIEQSVVCVDIESLNFYPADYIDSLKLFRYENATKKFTDSLYYSFSSELYANLNYYKSITPAHFDYSTLGRDSIDEKTYLKGSSEENLALSYAAKFNRNLIRNRNEYGVDPSKIQAIWNKNFNNTILATKAFEIRMQFIHSTCNGNIVDHYTQNINLPMHSVDSLAALKFPSHKDKFNEFAREKIGGVSLHDVRYKMLQSYFAEKEQLYREAAIRAKQKYEHENQKAKQSADSLSSKRSIDVAEMNSVAFAKELNINLDEAYRKIGKKRPTAINFTSNANFTISSTGWNNLDKYVLESTTNRTTLNYTDPDKGKKAIIRFDSLNVTVDFSSTYERLFVYLIPRQLNSFVLLNASNQVYSYSCNELIDYDLVTIGYKENKTFLAVIEHVQPSNLKHALKETKSEEISELFKKIDAQKSNSNLTDELRYLESLEKEGKRIKKYQFDQQLRTYIRGSIFPCVPYGTVSESIKETEEFLPK